MAKTFTLDVNNIKQGYAKSNLVHQHESRSHAYFYETKYHIYHLGIMHWEKRKHEMDKQRHQAMLQDTESMFDDL